MEKWQTLSPRRRLFDLAARLGSLEGYLYSEEKVDKSYLHNWLGNVDSEFRSLPDDLKAEVHADYLELLRKVEALLKRLYGEKDADTVQVTGMIGALKSRRG